MKRKVWTLSPWFIIFSIVMFAMALLSYNFSFELFCIELSLAVISCALVIVFNLRFKKYISKTISKTVKNLRTANPKFLERYKMPVVAVGRFGDIVWSNARFKKNLCQAKDPHNESISAFLNGKKIEDVLSAESVDVFHDGKQYTVFTTETDDGYVCFFIDDTYYKDIQKKYVESQKAVALIVFDNYEEFINDSEEESARVVLSLETALLRFANENNALFKKLSTNKYLVVFDSVNLDKLVGKKFPILQEVKNINYRGNVATISIGIGHKSDNLVESELQARKALDMALGRGGDQVAIMTTDGNYEFFGGTSVGVEKLSKVRSRVIATSIERTIMESDRVLIMGHRFADLDCIGSAVGLQAVIKKGLKKHCRIVVNKNNALASNLIDMVEQEGSNIFVSPQEALKDISPRTLLIIVDTHIPTFVESKEILDKCKRVVVIDHHRKSVDFISDAIVFYHEPISSSASEMVTELLTYMGESSISKVQATALLSGIMLDTKNFVVRTGVRTFEAAAFLRKKGADTVETKNLFANNIESYKEKYKIVSSAEVIDGYAISTAEGLQGDARVIAAQAADELLSVSDVLASFVVFNTKDNVVNISARSFGKVNVQLVMEILGGGGHQNMAATQINDITLSQGKEMLLEAIKKVISDNYSEE